MNYYEDEMEMFMQGLWPDPPESDDEYDDDKYDDDDCDEEDDCDDDDE